MLINQLRFVFVLISILVLSACGGGSTDSSSSDYGENSGQGSDNGGASQASAVVMVSSNDDLSNANPLSDTITEGNVHIFFQEGSDWATRGIKKVNFYCCKSDETSHTWFPSDTTPPYKIDIDSSQYKDGNYELYIDVFFEDQNSPVPYYVNFDIDNSTLPGEAGNNPPTISGNPVRSVSEGATYSFTPTAHDVDGDVLSFKIINKPSWATFNTQTGRLAGTPSSQNVGTSSNIIISVTDSTKTASLAPFDIEVTTQFPPSYGSTKLSWVPPTLYTDKTPLEKLGGYNIYYGTSLGNYTNKINLPNPGLTTYIVEKLRSHIKYYFVVTAYDSSGIESTFSNPVSVYVQ